MRTSCAPELKGRQSPLEKSTPPKSRKTFTDQLRVTFRWLLDPAADFLERVGIHPNVLTLLGVLGTGVSAVLAAKGMFAWSGFVFLLMSPIDALDGALARRLGEPENFGAFVDSVSDRYGELFIFGGLLWYSLQQESMIWSMAVYLAAFGSVLVSYIRARAQSLGMEAKVGLLSRVERILVLGPSLLFNIPLVGVGIIAVGANVTALHRILHVRAQAHRRHFSKREEQQA